jgi:cytochrome P450 family 142 subfamily A polypeptide 1
VPDFDLLDPEFYRDDPHTAFTWMRANEPVYRDAVNGLWAVSRHADLLDVERRIGVFVSGQGYRSWYVEEENSIIAMDDPEHLAQRRLVSNRFTPKAVRQHEPFFRSTIDELLAATKSGDDASKEVARKKAMELYPKAAESMRNDPTSAAKIGACIAKAADLDNY